MTTKQFRTNLNCGSCVAAVTPYLNGQQSIHKWNIDTQDPRKILTVESDDVSTEEISRLVSQAGFRVFEELQTPAGGPAQLLTLTPLPSAEPEKSWLATYQPLLLVLGYLIGVVTLIEVQADSIQFMRAMGNFMGGFFLIFSFFKLLNLNGFVNAYQTYDILAKHSRAYSYVYPFLELALGVAYVVNFAPVFTNVTTLVLMLIGLVGVTQAVFSKQKIRCACLGSLFVLPMSVVTMIEDGVMACMALLMLIGQNWH